MEVFCHATSRDYWCRMCLPEQVMAIEQLLRPLPVDCAELMRSYLVAYSDRPSEQVDSWEAAFKRSILRRIRARKAEGGGDL